MSGRPAVSIVIPTRNRAARLSRLLDALARQTTAAEDFEVVIVDDGSTDETAEVIASVTKRGHLRLRSASGGGDGPAAARNRGWRLAEGPLIAFTDDDCEPAPDWLERGLAAWGGDEMRIVQGRTLPNPTDAAGAGPLARTKRIEEASPFFQTCNVFYARELLERLGGFDESYRRPAGEDSDLGWRALEAGASRYFEPAAIVHHAIESRSPAEFLREATTGSEGARVVRRHPAMRAEAAYYRYFWSRTHARLLAAVVGAALVPVTPLTAVLALPYLRGLLGRLRSGRAHPGFIPVLVCYDAIDVGKALTASVRYRVLMI